MTSSIVVTSSIVRQSFGSPTAVWLLFLLHRGPLLGKPSEPSALLQGPHCWAVTGAGFWKSRALSQLLPSSMRMVGEADSPGMARVSLTLPRPSSWDRRSLQGPRPCTTFQTWAQPHEKPFWPCSVILQHEADGLDGSEKTLLWAVRIS